MKTKPISFLGTILFVFFCTTAKAQPSVTASAVWLTNCTEDNFLNTTGSIGTSSLPNNLGVYTQNSGSLILRGAQVNTSHNPASSNVCLAHLYYNIHLQSNAAGAFTSVDLPLLESCSSGSF